MNKKNFAAIAAESFNTVAIAAEGNGPIIWTVENIIKAAAAAGAQQANVQLTNAEAEAIGKQVLAAINKLMQQE